MHMTFYPVDYSWPGTRSSPSYKSPPARPSCSTWPPRCLYWPDTPRLRSSGNLFKIKQTQLLMHSKREITLQIINILQPNSTYKIVIKIEIIISKLEVFDLNPKFNVIHMTYHELWPGSRRPFLAQGCVSAGLQAQQTPLADLAHCVASSLL